MENIQDARPGAEPAEGSRNEGGKPFAAPEEMAQAAGLRYVNDGEEGYLRKRWGRGFAYIGPHGKHVKDSPQLERFKALVIPPGWTEVWICRTADGHIQATGRDDQGRKQYIYHPKWEEARTRKKFNKLIPFGEALPQLRSRVEQDLQRRKLSREKVVAIVVRLLEETLIRVGNMEYARQNRSYGLTTLQDDHLEISGSRMDFEFNGKSGKQVAVAIQDRRLAGMVQRIQDLPGQQLFQYVNEDGACCQSLTSTDVNDYLREITGQDFTAKDFRTWGGTVLGAIELYSLGPGDSERETQQRIVQAVKSVAEALNNTPAVCREYYIHPEIFASFQDHSLFPMMQEAVDQPAGTVSSLSGGLNPVEEAVLNLLRQRNPGQERQASRGAHMVVADDDPFVGGQLP